MSGVDYSSPVVTKTDLHKVEKRIETNTTLTEIPLASAANVLYYNATTKAVSYNTAPGGGGGAPICLVANQTAAVTLPAATSTLTLEFSSVNTSTGGFSAVGSNTFRWEAARTGVFIAQFVARVTNSNTSMSPTPTFVRVAAQIFTGPSGSPTALALSTGTCIVNTRSNALTGDSESTTEANLVLFSQRFSLNTNQVIQVRAGQDSAFASGVLFDGVSISPGTVPVPYDAPSYTLYVQEVSA